MSHYHQKKVGLENDQRNTNIHKIKRLYGQTQNPRDQRAYREEYSNDALLRKTRRFKEEQEIQERVCYTPEEGLIEEPVAPIIN